MKTLTIKETNALQAFAKADTSGKDLLTNLFGKEVFNQKITDRVKTFEDAAAIVDISDNQKTLIGYNGNDADLLGAQAFLMLTSIAKALNGGWTPDWNNSSQYKYYPYFDMRSGFSFDDVGIYYSDSDLGSRLCFKNEALAKYAGTQFLDLYRQMMVLPS